jgi:hypothetical protein
VFKETMISIAPRAKYKHLHIGTLSSFADYFTRHRSSVISQKGLGVWWVWSLPLQLTISWSPNGWGGLGDEEFSRFNNYPIQQLHGSTIYPFNQTPVTGQLVDL